ncbi:MAG: hypothetical protein D6719_00350, partial [Candidatus Dadabacteria bacterium]
MNTEEFEKQFADYLEGTMNKEEKEQFEAALEFNRELKNSLKEYQTLLSIEKLLSEEKHEPGPNFTAKVMERLDQKESFLLGMGSWLQALS